MDGFGDGGPCNIGINPSLTLTNTNTCTGYSALATSTSTLLNTIFLTENYCGGTRS